MDRSISNLSAEVPEFPAHFFGFPAVFPGFSSIFPAFLALVFGPFWTIVSVNHPVIPPVNLGHFRHTLDYFRDINDRLINGHSLEILGTGRILTANTLDLESGQSA